jgi:hypothetical protein
LEFACSMFGCSMLIFGICYLLFGICLLDTCIKCLVSWYLILDTDTWYLLPAVFDPIYLVLLSRIECVWNNYEIWMKYQSNVCLPNVLYRWSWNRELNSAYLSTKRGCRPSFWGVSGRVPTVVK